MVTELTFMFATINLNPDQCSCLVIKLNENQLNCALSGWTVYAESSLDPFFLILVWMHVIVSVSLNKICNSDDFYSRSVSLTKQISLNMDSFFTIHKLSREKETMKFFQGEYSKDLDCCIRPALEAWSDLKIILRSACKSEAKTTTNTRSKQRKKE